MPRGGIPDLEILGIAGGGQHGAVRAELHPRNGLGMAKLQFSLLKGLCPSKKQNGSRKAEHSAKAMIVPLSIPRRQQRRSLGGLE